MTRKQDKKKRSKKKEQSAGLLTGTLDITRSGMGFVIVDKLENDIIVRPSDFNTALNGDTVRVKIMSDGTSRGKRSQGAVVEVVKRKQSEFLGKLQFSKNFAFFIAESDKPMPDIFIPLDKTLDATDSDKVVVKIVEWEKNKKPVGEVIQILEPGNESDFAMKELLMEAGFVLEFSDDALEQAGRIPDVIPASVIAERRDCREILTFTIDPVDARDFDDALSIRKLDNGNYEIGVHIADVSHYVQPGTELDNDAYGKATSVYLPDRVNPMLPEHISNFLCSLRPHEDKLTFSAVFQMTPKGQVKQYWLGKTVIHSNHRFTYEEVQEVIEKEDGLYVDEVLLLNNIAQRLRKKRFDARA